MYRWAFLCVAASLCSAQSEKPKALFPVITAVVNGASFQPGIVSGSWATILGTDLATTTRSWTDADFYLGQLPTALSYTGVIVGGVPAYVAYISATQINFLVPDSAALGNVTVLVTEEFNSSNVFTTTKLALSPALFTVAAHNADGTLVTTANPAHPGEVVQLFGTGFGPSNPIIPTGTLFSTPAPVAGAITATLGGQAAQVAGYLIYPGVYQLNVTIPDLPAGDAAVEIKMGSNSTQTGLSLPIGK